jgi:NADPH:quinone reductase-like Zn-dependent oxidoreductase
MRAVVIHEYGGPEVLKLEERPEPQVRDTEILVEVHATSVNPVDTKVRQNSSAQRTLPLILGFDVSGVVVRCGSLVTQWKPGDEVFATPNLFRNGANAEDVVKRVQALTAGRGVPVVIDTVGGDTFLQTLDCAALNGQIVTILGSNTGDRGRGLLYRNVTIHYEFVGVPTAHEIEPERPGNILTSIANLVDSGLLRPHVSHRFALEDVAEGHRQVETGRTVGKVAIIVRR